MKKLELYGKRWFQKSFGNTYFSAVALLDGVEIARINFEYGYGDHWLDRILSEVSKIAESLGLPDNQVKGNGYTSHPWQYIKHLEANGLFVFNHCSDVDRKRDL